MRIRCTFKREGPGPSEQIVSVLTREGEEQFVLSKRKMDHDKIDVGEPLLIENGMYLIELPRETASGKWRVWMSESEVEDIRMMAAE